MTAFRLKLSKVLGSIASVIVLAVSVFRMVMECKDSRIESNLHFLEISVILFSLAI